MSRKKKRILIGVVIAVLVLGGIGVYAASSYGSQSDPLITKSYLDQVLTPDMEARIQEEVDAALSAYQGQTGGDAFTVVTLSQGQKITCGVGCEIMLRIGTAKAAGADYPVLVDTTTAESVSNGQALTANHLYMVTIKGNGVTATASTVKLLIKGEYTIS
ncbi:MAG: hypothetical protein ACI4PC_00545 [Oscillospiraceae bacterium]